MIDILKEFIKRPIKENFGQYEYSLDPVNTSRREDNILFTPRKMKEFKEGRTENMTSEDIKMLLNLKNKDFDKWDVKNRVVYHGGCLGCITQRINEDICPSCMYYDIDDDNKLMQEFRRPLFTKHNMTGERPWWRTDDRNMYLDYESDYIKDILELFNKSNFRETNPEHFL